ncbi:MAG: hypothetical protein M3Q52_08780 [Pseudomonadota bacterium]|nr:hypothetical protein [Pseudomonadota bacterium]
MFGLIALAALAIDWSSFQPQGRWAKPTDELASDLLPPDLAADAVSHRFSVPITQGGDPTSVRFVGHGRDSGDGFCVRKSYYVSTLVRPEGAEPQSPVSGYQVRLGGCDGQFAHVNPGASLDGAKRALLWLEWAQRTARSAWSLPFRIACISETDKDRCAGGARKALAELPLRKTFIVTNDPDSAPHRWTLAITETEPGEMLWDVTIDASPSDASVDLNWKIPPPF